MPRVVQSISDLSIYKKVVLLPTCRIYLACPSALSIAARDSNFSQGCGFVTVDSPDSELKGTLRMKRERLLPFLWLSREMEAEAALLL